MKVRVHYLFSKNDKVGSKIIQWSSQHQYNTKETPSHVALLIDNRWVFESTLFTGVRVIPYKEWLSINTEIDKIECTQERQYSDIKAVYKEIQDKGYDWLGTTYLGIWLLANKLFKVKIPKDNKWESECLYFCCEGVAKLLGLSNFAMKTPVDVWIDLKKLL